MRVFVIYCLWNVKRGKLLQWHSWRGTKNRPSYLSFWVLILGLTHGILLASFYICFAVSEIRHVPCHVGRNSLIARKRII